MKPMTPRPLEWIDTAPVAVTRDRRIQAPPEVVWDVIADHARWPEWFNGLDSVDPGHPSTGIGGTRVVHLTGLSVAEEFLAWEPGARFAFTGTGASRGVLRSLVENIVLARAGDSATDVSYTMAVDPVGGRPVAVVLRQVFSQTIKRGLDGLTAVAESKG